MSAGPVMPGAEPRTTTAPPPSRAVAETIPPTASITPAAPPRPSRASRASRADVSALDRAPIALLAGAIALVATAGATGLFEPTETRFAEIAREMRATGDWLTPRLDLLPHFHKPPIAYWATALGFSAFGENAWGARLPGAAATAAGWVAVAVAVRRRFASLGARPGIAVWLLATALLPFGLGRLVATDPYLASAVAGFWALSPSTWALAAIGLGFATKGPVVLAFTALPVVAAAAWGRDRGTLRLLGPPLGWILAVAIAVPWYAIVAARTPGLLGYLVGNQVWERYATQVHGRAGPWWYFIATLAMGLLPWTPIMVAGIARAWRERRREEARLLLAWLAAPLVFLSFSGSKLTAYLLPALPAAAVLAALGWPRAGRVARGVTVALSLALAAFIVVSAPPMLAKVAGVTPGDLTPMPGLWVVATGLAFAGAFVWRRRAGAAGAMTLAAWVALVATLARYDGVVGSPEPLARLLAENRAPGEPVVVYERFNAGLAFYLREPVRLLEVPREDQFADPSTLSQIYATRDSVVAWTRSRGRVWLLGRRETMPPLVDSLDLEWTRLASWRGRELGFVALRSP